MPVPKKKISRGKKQKRRNANWVIVAHRQAARALQRAQRTLTAPGSEASSEATAS